MDAIRKYVLVAVLTAAAVGNVFVIRIVSPVPHEESARKQIGDSSSGKKSGPSFSAATNDSSKHPESKPNWYIAEVTDANYAQEVLTPKKTIPIFIWFVQPYRSSVSKADNCVLEQAALRYAGKVKFVKIDPTKILNQSVIARDLVLGSAYYIRKASFPGRYDYSLQVARVTMESTSPLTAREIEANITYFLDPRNNDYLPGEDIYAAPIPKEPRPRLPLIEVSQSGFGLEVRSIEYEPVLFWDKTTSPKAFAAADEKSMEEAAARWSNKVRFRKINYPNPFCSGNYAVRFFILPPWMSQGKDGVRESFVFQDCRSGKRLTQSDIDNTIEGYFKLHPRQ